MDLFGREDILSCIPLEIQTFGEFEKFRSGCLLTFSDDFNFSISATCQFGMPLVRLPFSRYFSPEVVVSHSSVITQ